METKITLDEVQSLFDHFRKTRLNKKVKIPDTLWRSAIALTKNYKVSYIIKTLGLSGGDFQKKKNLFSKKNDSKKCKKLSFLNEDLMPLVPKDVSVNSFIKIPMDQTTMRATTASCITLQRGGTQLSLHAPSDEQIHLFINTLFR
jgi:hypothetical protein